ncbi:MAG: hypothetical protein KGY66_04490 [Candidatus Thermoplasmatota archaeon]|nr:hypothetical protein [Candidatus Thermoplasmatota archaeon]MBS3790156.1 hypothetical protein [Candidatus Thermoplasmatota archaeon]
MLTLVLADCEVEVEAENIDSVRSKPEVVHFPLLLSQDSGLAEERELRTILHTRDGKIFQFESDAYIPDSLEKFKKLLIEATKGNTTPEGVRVFEKGLIETLDEQFGKKIVMTPKGGKEDPTDIFSRAEDYVVVIGGFRKGDFESPVYEWAEKQVSISDRLMKPWSVTAEILVGYRYCSFE